MRREGALRVFMTVLPAATCFSGAGAYQLHNKGYGNTGMITTGARDVRRYSQAADVVHPVCVHDLVCGGQAQSDKAVHRQELCALTVS